MPFPDIEASPGSGGAVPHYEPVKNVISFERSFLRNPGAKPDHCKIITARGDSMEPTIPNGSLIVVDLSQPEAVNSRISVINVYGELLVKPIRRRFNGSVELVSDNPVYPLETIEPDHIDQLVMIRRVVYFCSLPQEKTDHQKTEKPFLKRHT